MAKPPDIYNQDFYIWAMTTSELIRQKKWHEIDGDAVIEEIEGLARRDKRELAIRLERLLIHLLKWCAQPQGRQLGHSWRDTIHEQRSEIDLLLDDSSSLRHEVDALLNQRYRKARERALDQTGLHETALPPTCPWTSAQMLGDDFWPESW
jgi:uncharacterized protein DUF29